MSFNEIIERHVHFKKSDTHGFFNTDCPLCGDRRGRLGFNFNEGIFANCFNCGFKAYYKDKVNGNFRKLLKALGVTQEEIDQEEGRQFFNPTTLIADAKKKTPIIKSVELPAGSELIFESSSTWAEVAKEYLAWRLPGVNILSKKIYVSDKLPGFVIFPFYMHGRMVYWQARNMDASNKFRWKNSETPRDQIIFNFDELKYSDTVYVTEGIFDALAVNGMAILGSSLNKEKSDLLSTLKGDIIFVLQKKDANSKKLGLIALEKGWKVSAPSTDVKDVAESVQKYGQLWTISDIKNNVKSGLDGRIYVEFL